ncbi:MAG: ABC transporter permease, partial [Bacteroidota bacterium]
MLTSYFLVALRTLRRQTGYAVINVLGLALGLACFVLIAVFVEHEWSFDRHHPEADRLYRVEQVMPRAFMGTRRFPATPAPLAQTLVADFPEVEAATALTEDEALLSYGEAHYVQYGFKADPSFFEVFGIPLVQGEAATALAAPRSLVLTIPLATKLFGDEALADQAVLGQTVRLRDDTDFTVTGLVAAPPETSSFGFTYVATLVDDGTFTSNLDQWSMSGWNTFVRLAEGADADAFHAQMPAFLDRYRYTDPEEQPPSAQRVQYTLQPLLALHLDAELSYDLGTRGDARTVALYAIIGVVILLLACVNYTNLAVARSIKRAQEVGVRKAIGGRRAQIVAQFLGESILMTALALVLALGLVHALLPTFGDLVERPLAIDYASGGLVPGLALLVLTVGVVAGSYPALFMARLEPMQVLKGTVRGSRSRPMLQRVLIVGQYAASIVLVVGSLVVFQQLQFVSQSDPGYERENVVTMQLPHWTLSGLYPPVRDAWLDDASVTAVTAMQGLPTSISSSTSIAAWDGHVGDEDVQLQFYQTITDYEILDVFGIDLVAGRSFSRDLASDSLGAVLVNETAVQALGWTPQQAIGRWIGSEEQRIVGVIRDFHQHSMHLPIAPLLLRLQPDGLTTFAARVQPGDLPTTLDRLHAAAAQFTSYPLELRFLDAEFDKLYRADRRLGQTFGFFTIAALL